MKKLLLVIILILSCTSFAFSETNLKYGSYKIILSEVEESTSYRIYFKEVGTSEIFFLSNEGNNFIIDKGTFYPEKKYEIWATSFMNDVESLKGESIIVSIGKNPLANWLPDQYEQEIDPRIIEIVDFLIPYFK